MDSKSVTESKTSYGNYSDSEIYAKLRRLKIQEEILYAAASKSSRKSNSDECESFRYTDELNLRKYIADIKKAYAEIKNLFDDVKVLTKDQENLKNIDIDDIKRDIFELDKKIKSLKDFICKETSILKVAEKEILTQIHENQDKLQHKLISRTHLKPQYNEVVPSPVRAIIKSPFKCIEVQRFHDFMKNSGNRYGGWEEYNHSIFVSIWNKYFNSNEILQKSSIFEDTSYIPFQDEVLQKIFGIKPEEIKSHADWYLQYVQLKKCQEFALNKWRENKQKIKNPKRIAKEDSAQKKKADEKHFKQKCKRNSLHFKGHRNKSNEHGPELSDMEDLFCDLNLRDDDSSESLDVKFILDNKKERGSFKRICLNKVQTLNKTIKSFHPGKGLPGGYSTDRFVDGIKKLKTPMWRIDLK